jgi:DNA-binding NtrC family response regulator
MLCRIKRPTEFVRERDLTMVRVGLYSEDTTLYPALSSALGNGFRVTLVKNEAEATLLISRSACDVLILNLDAELNGSQSQLECFRRMIKSDVLCIVMGDDRIRPLALELVRDGAYGYCRKPPSIVDLKTILLRAYEHNSLRQEVNKTQQLQTVDSANAEGQCDQMIGSSPQMRTVYELVGRVTGINASVLITGESGTGKELIATAIHKLGTRANKPFVAVSCGAIPETLIESELFGHEKGAFTDSSGVRVGYMEQAADGTLFLDEIGELSLTTQVKLLRVLQQREFSRLGSNRLLPLRARVIFATHKDLESMVAAGTFRQDLYYRINVMRIDAPGLREHPEDLPQLVLHFLKHYSELYGRPMPTIEPRAMSALQDYSWPGNVRELENVIQRLIIVSSEDVIAMESLPDNILDEVLDDRLIQNNDIVMIDGYRFASSFESKIRVFKVSLAANAVRDNHGNKTMAARSLQISRAYLHRLIRDPELSGADEECSPGREIA